MTKDTKTQNFLRLYCNCGVILTLRTHHKNHSHDKKHRNNMGGDADDASMVLDYRIL